MQETSRACQAWADYVAMGPDRSLDKLLNAYRMRTSAPTTELTTLKRWSRAFGWQERLQTIADAEVVAAVERERAYQREIMDTGYATPLERVRLLKEMVATLEADLKGDRRWLRDTKGIGAGENWREVEIERFNAAEFDTLRGLLDDLAKETSGRPRTVKVDVEMYIRRRASEMGLDPDAAVREAELILSNGAGTRAD
jgi:hypothetical protein